MLKSKKMNDKKRVFLIIIDGFGVGDMPDSQKYDNCESNTYEHIANKVMIHVPNLVKMGINNIDGLRLEKVKEPIGAYGKLAVKNQMNNSQEGFWEMGGFMLENPFETFCDDIPEYLVLRIEESIKNQTLCNKVSSFSDVIKRYGQVSIDLKQPIVYACDYASRIEVAMHEDVCSFEELLRITKKIREVVGEEVASVFAVQFAGSIGQFYRSHERVEYNVMPKKPTLFEQIKNSGKKVVVLGKVVEMVGKEAVSASYTARTNGLQIKTIEKLLSNGFDNGLLISYLSDTDYVYGHRNDYLGYRRCLEEIDVMLGKLINSMQEGDMLIVCSDHGNDPTNLSSNHSREYVPFLAYGNMVKPNTNIGTLDSLEVVGQTIREYLCRVKGDKSVLTDITAK